MFWGWEKWKTRQSNILVLCKTRVDDLEQWKRKGELQEPEQQKVQRKQKETIGCLLPSISLLHTSYIQYSIGIYMIPISMVSEYPLFL